MEEEKMYGEPVSPNDGAPVDGGQPSSGFKAEADEGQAFSEHTEEHELPDAGEQAEDSFASDTDLHFAPQPAPPSASVDSLKQIDERLAGIAGTEQRLFSEVREMHRLYHNEFAGRLKAMQEELEQYRKIDKGRAFDDILGAVARIYSNNETLADEAEEPRVKKNIRYMLLDIEDLLDVYGMSKLRSVPGDKRDPRHCQVHIRIPTDDPAKHDTVAKSYNTGFHIGNRTVIKEAVDIYFYDGSATQAEAKEKQAAEDGGDPVLE